MKIVCATNASDVCIFDVGYDARGRCIHLGDLNDIAKNVGFSGAKARLLRPTPEMLIVLET